MNHNSVCQSYESMMSHKKCITDIIGVDVISTIILQYSGCTYGYDCFLSLKGLFVCSSNGTRRKLKKAILSFYFEDHQANFTIYYHGKNLIHIPINNTWEFFINKKKCELIHSIKIYIYNKRYQRSH